MDTYLVPRKKSHSLWRLGALTALAFSAAPNTLYAKTALDTPRWAISVNDGHSITLPNGKMATGSTYSPDSAVLIGFHGSQPFIGNGIELPGSVQGPPTMAWVSPNSNWAVVTSGAKAGSAPGAPLVPDTRVSVLSIEHGVPKLIQTVEAGLGPSGVAVSNDQKWALVANRVGGTVSVFKVVNKHLVDEKIIDFGKDSSPTTVEFLPNSQDAVVVLRKRNALALLVREKDGYRAAPNMVSVWSSPNTMDISHASGLIAVAGMDKVAPGVSILRADQTGLHELYRFPVAPGPEPLHFSPDGRILAVGSVNDSNAHPERKGSVSLYHLDEKSATKIAEAPVGHWPQGIIFSPDGHTLIVQNNTDQSLGVYHVEPEALTFERDIPLGVGPSASASAW